MKIEEFRAWLLGYTEEMTNPPNKKQWEKIKEKINEIDGSPITPVWIEKNYPYYYRDWLPRTYLMDITGHNVLDATDATDISYQIGKYESSISTFK